MYLSTLMLPLARSRSVGQLPAMPNSFRTTLWRVLLVQLIALALLWLLQQRYSMPGT